MNIKSLPCTIYFLACLFSDTNAQIKKGALFLGGDISFNTAKYDIEVPQDETKKRRSILFRPVIGKAIRDNTIIGLSLEYGSSTSDNIANAVAQDYLQYGAHIFLRQYKPLGAGFSLFGEGSLAYYQTKTIYYRDIQTDRITGPSVSLFLFPGLSYSLNKKLQLETSFYRLFEIGYNRENREVKDKADQLMEKVTTDYFGVYTTFENMASFTLGLRVLINK